MSRLRAYLSSIRGRFLTYFLVGMLATLVLVFVINHITVGHVFTRLNEDISQLEFVQVKSSINAVLESADKIGTDLLFSNNMMSLTTQVNRRDYLSAIYYINLIKTEISALLLARPEIESIYLYVGDDFILQTSGAYTTLVYSARNAGRPSARVLQAVAEAGRELTAMGGLTAEDLPLHTKTDAKDLDAPLLMLYKSVNFQRTKLTCGINLYEQAVSGLFRDIVSGTQRSLRLITPDMTVVSALDTTELGAPFPYADFGDISENGEAALGNVRLMWRPLYNGALVAVNEVPVDSLLNTINPIQQRATVAFIAGMSVTCVLFMLWLQRVIAPLGPLVRGMQRAGEGHYDEELPVHGADEFSVLTQQYNHMVEDLRRFTEQLRLSEKAVRDIELQALRNQINPHFLYNTLNSIRWMAVLSGNESIERCTIALGNILQPLYKNDQPDCALEDELALMANYMEIMNIRYDRMIDYVDDVPENLRGARMPRLVLQPLVENAIIHGLAPTGRRGTVRITAEAKGQLLAIHVTDDGDGLSNSALARQNDRLNDEQNIENIGLLNVCRRVRLLYGPDLYGLRLSHNAPAGVRVTLSLPYQAAEPETASS